MSASFERTALGFMAVVVVAGSLSAVFPPSCDFAGRPHQGSAEGAAVGQPAAGDALATPSADLVDAPAIDLAAIAAGAPVPRAIGWPDDGRGVKLGETPQDAFIARVLPFVLLVAEEVRGERARLWAIRQQLNQGGSLAAEDRLWLGAAAERYQVGRNDIPELSRRIDTVPASLLLAAAALATRWNIADEPAWRAMAATVVPNVPASASRDAPAGAVPPPTAALSRYLWAINTQPAYLPFRRARERARLAGAPLSGPGLAATLPRVAPAPLPGATALAAAITSRQLDRFDAARLAAGRG